MESTCLWLCEALFLAAPVSAAKATVQLTDFDIGADGLDPVTEWFSYQQRQGLRDRGRALPL